LLICVTSASAPIAQAFQPNLRCQAQGGIHNDGLGLLALLQRRFADRVGNGHGSRQNKTNDRAILQEFWNPATPQGCSRD
jgi:hypothetical protein